MTPFTITTKDDITFTVSEVSYFKYLKDFTQFGTFVIEGNTVSRRDEPRFRKGISKPDMLRVSSEVFEQQPNHIVTYNRQLLSRSARYIKKYGSERRIHYSLLAAVSAFVKHTMDMAHHYDADLVFDLADANYDYLQDHNVSPTKTDLTDTEVLSPIARQLYRLGSLYTRLVYQESPRIVSRTYTA